MYVISLWRPCWVAMVGVTVAVQAGRGGYDDGVDLISGSSNISINHRGAAQRFCCVVVLSGTGRVRTNLKASVVLRVQTCTCGRGTVLIPHFFTQLDAAFQSAQWSLWMDMRWVCCWSAYCKHCDINDEPMSWRLLYLATMVVAGNSGNSVWEAKLWIIVAALLCLDMQPDNLEYVNWLKQDDQVVVHAQGFSIKGSSKGSIKQSYPSNNGTTTDKHEHAYSESYSCIRLTLFHGTHGEDVVLMLFGVNHRRWMTTSPLLVLRFNSGDTSSLSSVRVILYLQLNPQPTCIRQIDRRESHPRGINWYGAQRPLKIAIVAYSNPSC